MKLTFDIIDPANVATPLHGNNPHFVEGRTFDYHIFTESDQLISGQGQKIGMHWSFRQGGKSVFDRDLKPVRAFGISTGKTDLIPGSFEPLDLTDLPDGTYEVLVSLVGRGQLPILETITKTLRFDRTDTYLVTEAEPAKKLEEWQYDVNRGLKEHRDWIKRVETSFEARMSALEKRINAD